MDYSDDLVGVEMCAAIKNIYSMVIGSVRKILIQQLFLCKSLNSRNGKIY